MKYQSISEEIRKLMLEEFEYDLKCDNCYYSKRFNDIGVGCFVEVMSRHIIEGTDDQLGEDLKTRGCFKSHEERKTKNGIIMAKVPETAAATFAEGEFNRFYARAVCRKAIEENKKVIVYRARGSQSPRADSEALIGSVIEPEKLLSDLRKNIGMDTALNLPNGPNSGLSVLLS